MKTEDLIDAIGGIQDEFITDAHAEQKKVTGIGVYKKRIVAILSAAACFGIVVFGVYHPTLKNYPQIMPQPPVDGSAGTSDAEHSADDSLTAEDATFPSLQQEDLDDQSLEAGQEIAQEGQQTSGTEPQIQGQSQMQEQPQIQEQPQQAPSSEQRSQSKSTDDSAARSEGAQANVAQDEGTAVVMNEANIADSNGALASGSAISESVKARETYPDDESGSHGITDAITDGADEAASEVHAGEGENGSADSVGPVYLIRDDGTMEYVPTCEILQEADSGGLIEWTDVKGTEKIR